MKKEENERGKDKKRLYRGTKLLVDIIFIVEIIAVIIMPVAVPWINRYYPGLKGMDIPVLTVYMLIGIICGFATFELKKILRTVVEENCFVQGNVTSLKKISIGFFLLAVMLVIRGILYPTIAILVETFLFILAWIFCLVVARVFEEAVRYKEENDLTI